MPSKTSFLSCVLFVAMLGVAFSQDTANIKNFRKLLENPSFMMAQFRCILDGKPCDRVGLRISKLLPDSVRTGQCVGCTEEELVHVEEVHEFIRTNYPEKYEEIKRKYNITDDHPSE